MGFGGHIKINIFNKFDNFSIGTVNDSVLNDPGTKPSSRRGRQAPDLSTPYVPFGIAPFKGFILGNPHEIKPFYPHDSHTFFLIQKFAVRVLR
ncbi:hypothetical protein FHS14_002216 [Paenibacillus baekrokdamisoli]|nr:hypothetical protein [Paenibacillus baekrokdamisoli]